MYRYAPLQNAEDEIRLVELFPGGFNDRIKIAIHHVTLREPAAPYGNSLRTNLDQLQASLPSGWVAYRTIQGRILFENETVDEFCWTHPNEQIDPSCYELTSDMATFEPQFEALSYAWGSDDKSKTFEVTNTLFKSDDSLHIGSSRLSEPNNGLGHLPVTESLFEAFQHLRHGDTSRLLWADAICINQEDSAEKAFQVRRMADIYRLAHRVILWLGIESDTSDLALSTFRYIATQIEYDENLQWVLRSPDAEERNWSNESFETSFEQEAMVAIRDLLSRPWFERLWVIQEMHLAKKQPGALAQCGLSTIAFSSFQKAIIFLFTHSDLESTALLTKAYNVIRPKKDVVFSRLPFQVTQQICKDPRDRVYGILGLAPRRFASGIRVSYEDGISAGQTYKSAFLTHVRLVQRLELFGFCFPTSESENQPSWVPNWSQKFPGKAGVMSQLSALTSRAHIIHNETNPDVLQVMGIRCTVVKAVTRPLQRSLGAVDAIRHVRQWQPSGFETQLYQPTGEPLHTAYALTLLNGDVSERSVRYGAERSLHQWMQQAFTNGLFGSHLSEPNPPPLSHSDQVHRRVTEALGYCSGRAFFETDDNYIGLSAFDTKIGDIVVILLGCSNPVVLRPMKDGSYRLIGECFVHGLQDGVQILGPLPEPWKAVSNLGPGFRHIIEFFNAESGQTTVEDPRMDPCSDWERVEKNADADDPIHYCFFKNKGTGEIINYDPRLEPEVLERRGVKLAWFSLV